MDRFLKEMGWEIPIKYLWALLEIMKLECVPAGELLQEYTGNGRMGGEVWY